ncbi:MAG: hypothetical protein JNG86_23100 [Verrucomicrobiaceae bacterium]|nr:hypothetical protein [Verrucomicrobiaceae bacterium]
MTSRFTISLVFFACWLLPRLQAASIMVNEYRNGSSTAGPGTKMVRDEFIEFIITENTSAASLAALTFGDSNDATSMLQGVFRFDQGTLDTALANAGLGEFLPGTLIVVKGINLGAQSLAYDPLNGGWSLELVAGQGARDHSETLINGNINFGNNGEVVWVSSSNPPARNSDTSGFIHAIGHDNNPGLIANTVAAAFGSENILLSTVTTGRSVANVGDSTESLAVTTTATMGATNGGSNSTWVEGLRTSALSVTSAPEPGRASLFMLALFALQNRRVRQGGLHA